jgi:hypothetical protein
MVFIRGGFTLDSTVWGWPCIQKNRISHDWDAVSSKCLHTWAGDPKRTQWEDSLANLPSSNSAKLVACHPLELEQIQCFTAKSIQWYLLATWHVHCVVALLLDRIRSSLWVHWKDQFKWKRSAKTNLRFSQLSAKARALKFSQSAKMQKIVSVIRTNW